MEFTEEQKRDIVESFVDIFTRISSKEFQRRIWINGEGPEVDSYDDTVNEYFGECDSILENYKEFGISDRQYQLLEKFTNLFRHFADENYWPTEFIDSQEWESITDLAKEILKAFNYQRIRK
jgi:hypothetical protein